MDDMKSEDSEKKLKKTVEEKIATIEKAKKDESTLLAQTVYLGTLSVLFIIPVIFGAYLGLWLDERLTGFSISWTVSLIIVGVAVGAFNVYLFIKD